MFRLVPLAWVGLATGTIITIVWGLTPWPSPLLYELIPAFAGGLLVTVIVGRLTAPPGDVDGIFARTKGD